MAKGKESIGTSSSIWVAARIHLKISVVLLPKQIADHLNSHGFKTFLGRPFKQEDIRSMLSRQAIKASAHCRYEYILKAIRPLAETGYHPRTISSKLNAMGLKTVTGGKFNKRIVEHYLRIIKTLDAQSAGKEVN